MPKVIGWPSAKLYACLFIFEHTGAVKIVAANPLHLFANESGIICQPNKSVSQLIISYLLSALPTLHDLPQSVLMVQGEPRLSSTNLLLLLHVVFLSTDVLCHHTSF